MLSMLGWAPAPHDPNKIKSLKTISNNLYSNAWMVLQLQIVFGFRLKDTPDSSTLWCLFFKRQRSPGLTSKVHFPLCPFSLTLTFLSPPRPPLSSLRAPKQWLLGEGGERWWKQAEALQMLIHPKWKLPYSLYNVHQQSEKQRDQSALWGGGWCTVRINGAEGSTEEERGLSSVCSFLFLEPKTNS